MFVVVTSMHRVHTIPALTVQVGYVWLPPVYTQAYCTHTQLHRTHNMARVVPRSILTPHSMLCLYRKRKTHVSWRAPDPNKFRYGEQILDLLLPDNPGVHRSARDCVLEFARNTMNRHYIRLQAVVKGRNTWVFFYLMNKLGLEKELARAMELMTEVKPEVLPLLINPYDFVDRYKAMYGAVMKRNCSQTAFPLPKMSITRFCKNVAVEYK